MPAPTKIVKVFGWEIPMPKWGITLLSLVVIVGAGAAIYYQIVEPHLVSDQSALNTQLKEFQKHFAEKAAYSANPVYQDPRGTVGVDYFASDGCILVTRKSANPMVPMQQKWLTDVSQQAPTAMVVPKFSSLMMMSSHGAAFAQGNPANCTYVHVNDPNFRQWIGERQGCWVQIWRQWGDGCTEWQAFDQCNGIWGPANWVVCHH